jgi:hypothetical protein
LLRAALTSAPAQRMRNGEVTQIRVAARPSGARGAPARHCGGRATGCPALRAVPEHKRRGIAWHCHCKPCFNEVSESERVKRVAAVEVQRPASRRQRAGSEVSPNGRGPSAYAHAVRAGLRGLPHGDPARTGPRPGPPGGTAPTTQGRPCCASTHELCGRRVRLCRRRSATTRPIAKSRSHVCRGWSAAKRW